MATIKRILSIALTVGILCSGLPLSRPGDLSRDGRVDLQDTILLLKQFQQTAVEGGNFRADTSRVLTALRVVAGLKSVIKSKRPDQSTQGFFGPDAPYMATSFNLTVQPSFSVFMDHVSPAVESIRTAPPTHPPQFS